MKANAYKQNYLRGWTLFAAVLGILAILSWIIVFWDLDRFIAGRFYSETEGWYLVEKPPWIWLYKFGTIPGLLLALTALVVWLVDFHRDRLHHLHRYLLVIVLTAIIGPGILVNGLLKNYWSRPRPRQIQEFNGQWAYRHMFQPGRPGKGQSFTCGHCSMGFLFCSLLVFRRKNALLAWSGVITGLALGGLLSAARVVQGAHFLSDTLWSLGIVLMVTILLYYIVLKIPVVRPAPIKKMTEGRRRFVWGVSILVGIVMTVGFFMHRPFYKDHRLPLEIPAQANRILLKTSSEIPALKVQYSDARQSQLIMTTRGFAWIDARHYLRPNIQYRNKVLFIDLIEKKKGYFAELTHEVTIVLPEVFQNQIDVAIAK